jgi:ribosomal protein S14
MESGGMGGMEMSNKRTKAAKLQKCASCGVEHTLDELFSYVDGNNRSITKNSPELCRLCFLARYGEK